jgi:hypothetical protein
MPNGHPDFFVAILPQLEAFFSPIADTLLDFASRHNLAVDKYYHESPSWSLRFAHPKGGAGRVYALKREHDNASIYVGGSWSLNDYDTFTRFVRRTSVERSGLDASVLSETLERIFLEVMNWPLGEWSSVSSNFRNEWEGFTREQFLNMGPKNPIPRL